MPRAFSLFKKKGRDSEESEFFIREPLQKGKSGLQIEGALKLSCSMSNVLKKVFLDNFVKKNYNF